jgi:hypothetical protein
VSTRLRIPRRVARRARGESGATAIIVGLLSVVLFSLAGIAVDLGNAWARGRSIQKQADVSALASGYLLPQTTANKAAIADRVALVLNDNPTVGQQGGITGFQLINSDRSDGELLFQTPEGGPCLEDCPRMTLVPPPARVTFGLATVMGFEDVAVQRPATVEVQSALPPKNKMLPFWLPSGCGYGPTEADTSQGNSQGAPPPPESWVAPSSARMGAAVAAVAPAPTPVGTHTLTGNVLTTVTNGQTTEIYGYAVNGVSTGKYKKVSLRAYSPDGSTFVDFAADLPPSGQVPPFQIGPQDLTGTSGDWYVFALAAKSNGTLEYSANHLVIRVDGPAPAPTATPLPTELPTAAPSGVPIGCVGQDRGNFGQLDSPRAGYSSQQGFTLNIALGIDHSLAPYVFPPSIGEVKDCGPSSGVIPGGQLDDVAGAAGNGANCVKGDTGNDGPKTYDGLVGGVSPTIPGRLDAANGSTVCPSRSNLAVDGKQINNDSLACFLRNGATLDDLAQPGGVDPSMLSPEILASPRLVYLPVVYASDRAQKGFQPIKHFVPGFITEETQTTGPNDAAGHINGLTISGSSVKVMSVFTFNRAALPPVEEADTVPYDPSMGGAIVRLVG